MLYNTMTGSPSEITIREAHPSDLPDINEIYADAVRRTTATFDIEPPGERQRQAWFEEHGGKHPVVVAVDGVAVLGWGSLSPWSGRCAYSRTTEVSVYVREGSRGKGVGRALVEDLIERADAVGHHVILALIAQENDVSAVLFRRLGFRLTGTMHEVGEKFGRLLDVDIWERVGSS
jgi:phosphinothricin acetyltransferase